MTFGCGNRQQFLHILHAILRTKKNKKKKKKKKKRRSSRPRKDCISSPHCNACTCELNLPVVCRSAESPSLCESQVVIEDRMLGHSNGPADGETQGPSTEALGYGAQHRWGCQCKSILGAGLGEVGTSRLFVFVFVFWRHHTFLFLFSGSCCWWFCLQFSDRMFV